VTLRLRLVLAISLLVTVGLGAFGFVTYSLYSRSQYNQLDDQLRNSEPIVEAQLAERTGTSSGFGPPGFGTNGTSTGSGDTTSNANNGKSNGYGYPRSGQGGPERRPGPPVVPNPNTWAELRDSTGTAVTNGSIRLSDSDAQPDIPTGVSPGVFTTGSSTGSGDWRVLVSSVSQPQGGTIIVADPAGRAAAPGAHGHLRPLDQRRRPVGAGVAGRPHDRGR
jgi:hypothetical protein